MVKLSCNNVTVIININVMDGYYLYLIMHSVWNWLKLIFVFIINANIH